MKTNPAPTPRPHAAVMTFYVLRFKSYPVTAHLVLEKLFATRLQAERYLFKRTRAPWNYVVDYATWRERERIMFHEGIRVPLPFAEEPFFTQSSAITDHFPHISTRDPNLMAYTESPEKGELDRQQPIKVGRYLKTYFPDLTERQLTYYSEWFAQGNKPDEMGHAPLAFATTSDEIVDVYARGPHSCMRSKKAVAPYGAGDLSVAYLTNPENPEEVMARALCWPEKKVFGRVYPTVEYYPNQPHDHRLYGSQETARLYFKILQARLRKLGWTDILEDGNVFDGARMLKMPVASSSRRQVYRFPYLDNGVRFSSLDDDHWVLGADADNKAGDYSGTVYISDNRTWDYDIGSEFEFESVSDDDNDDDGYGCVSCGTGLDEDDTRTVFTSFSRGYAETWCCGCRDEYAFRCDATDEYYVSRTDDRVIFPDGTVWHLEAAVTDAFQCPVEGEWCPNDNGIEVQLSAGVDTTTLWCPDAVNTQAFVCGWNDVTYPLTYQSSRYPGFAIWDDENPNITPEARIDYAPELEQAA